MLNTTKGLTLPPSTQPGLLVVPDQLVIPIRVVEREDTPEAAAGAVARTAAEISRAGVGAELEALTYRAWTEKLAGKALVRRGVRHCAEAKLALSCDLDPEWNFVERVQRLEQLRAALASLDDTGSVQIGEAQWRVVQPEHHRAAVARDLQQRLATTATALGLELDEAQLSGELEVNVHGPMRAFVSLKVAVTFRRSR